MEQCGVEEAPALECVTETGWVKTVYFGRGYAHLAYAPVSSENCFRSMLPPETMATIFLIFYGFSGQRRREWHRARAF